MDAGRMRAAACRPTRGRRTRAMNTVANPTPSRHPSAPATSGPEAGATARPAGAHFREVGAGGGVVCLHASASSSGQWRPLMDRLAGRFRTLAADLYGAGQSPAWPGDRPLWLADEVALLTPIF